MKKITRTVDGVQYKLIKDGFKPVYLFNPTIDEVFDVVKNGYELELKLEGKFKVCLAEEEFCRLGKVEFIVE